MAEAKASLQKALVMDFDPKPSELTTSRLIIADKLI